MLDKYKSLIETINLVKSKNPYFDYFEKIFKPQIVPFDYIHFSLPVWTFKENMTFGNWINPFPFLCNSQYQAQYETLVNELSESNFSITDFCCKFLKELPNVFVFNFIDNGELSIKEYYCNAGLIYKVYIPLNCIVDEDVFTFKMFFKYKVKEKKKPEFESTINLLIDYLLKYKRTFINVKNILFIPSRVINDNREEEQSYGGAVIAESGNSISTNLELLHNIVIQINLLIRQTALEDWSFRLNYQAIKTAKTAIMSRNMSHNLGSHVMAYLKAKLRSVDKLVETGVLETIFKDCECSFYDDSDSNQVKCRIKEYLENSNNDDYNNKDNHPEMPFLVGLGHFIGYLQERQDYIATISTDYIPFFNTVNFKDTVYDHINIDKRYERHKNRSGYKPDNILLDNIARSEGITRNDICIKFRDFDGEDKEHLDLVKMRGIQVDLPGGVTGRQAVFSIIENIIRNAAKHNPRLEEGKKLVLSLDLLDLDKTDDKKRFSNLVIDESYKRIATEVCQNRYYVLTVTDNYENAQDEVINTLNKAVHEDYIDDTGKMLDAHKGIKEMRISASWLRNQDEEQIKQRVDVEEDLPPVIVTKDQQSNLQYVFFLCKPRTLAFVYENKDTNEIDELNSDFNSKYWHFFNIKELKTEENLNFDLFVAESDDVKNEIENISFAKVIVDNKPNLDDPDLETKLLEKYTANFAYALGLEELPKISIFDGYNSKNYEQNLEDKNNIYLGSEGEEKYKDSLIYKTHYSSPNEFGELESELDKIGIAPHFIEGITGHNATDRLIRNEELNKKWYYNHLVSALTKVAIFDERLFDNCYETELKEYKSLAQTNIEITILECINAIKEDNNIKDEEDKADEFYNLMDQVDKIDLYDKLESCFYEETSSAVIENNKVDLNCKIKVNQSFFNSFKHSKLFSEKDNLKLNYIPQVYDRKNIILFNLLEEEDGFLIVGKSKNFIERKFTEIVRLGKIYKDKVDFYSTNGAEGQVKKLFHYFSIHQGLLDKLYGKFKIKNDNEKIDFTTMLCDNILKQDIDKNAKSHRGFLIHSGRSKPAKSDMAQRQPFVQFAALENAVNEAKFILVELLNSSRYDKE